MAGKREKPEDIVLKLRQVEVLQGQDDLSFSFSGAHKSDNDTEFNAEVKYRF